MNTAPDITSEEGVHLARLAEFAPAHLTAAHVELELDASAAALAHVHPELKAEAQPLMLAKLGTELAGVVDAAIALLAAWLIMEPLMLWIALLLARGSEKGAY